MTELITAIICFIISHGIPAVAPLRAYLIRAKGFKMYVTMYSMISVGVLVWFGFAYIQAPYVEVWPFREWTRWVTITLMVPSSIFLVVGLLSPNPLSLSLVSPTSYDVARPGIVGIMRHPVIWVLGLWALGPQWGPCVGADVLSFIIAGFKRTKEPRWQASGQAG